MRKVLSFVIVMIIFGAWQIGCARQEQEVMPLPMGAETNMDHGDEHKSGAETVVGVREIVIIATEFAYEPSTITLEEGETVNITLINEGQVEHAADFGDLGLHLHTQPGAKDSGSLVAEEAGEYEIICTVAGHEDAGMVGSVDVEHAHGEY